MSKIAKDNDKQQRDEQRISNSIYKRFGSMHASKELSRGEQLQSHPKD
jgi:hypothetical protein